MLPITIDYNPAIAQTAGIGRLVRDQVQALLDFEHDMSYRLFFAASSTPKALPAAPNLSYRTTHLSLPWQMRLWHRLQLPLPVECLCGAFSIYHATDFVLPPTLSHSRTILTVHDLSFVRVPEAAPPALRRFLDRVVPRSIERATHIIADSTATKNDIIEVYGCAADKISVVLSSVSHRFRPVDDVMPVRQKYHLDTRPYFFALGTVQPRKNYSRIVRALHALGASYSNIVLVIAGGSGWLHDELYDTIRALNMTDRVRLIGFAEDTDLPALYSGALATLMPSTYEGFGFPVLESMACGTPVITSMISSLPEVAGDAALLVDPLSVDAIVTAMQRLITDTTLHACLSAAGKIQAAQFTPQRTAQDLASVYRHVLQMPH